MRELLEEQVVSARVSRTLRCPALLVLRRLPRDATVGGREEDGEKVFSYLVECACMDMKRAEGREKKEGNQSGEKQSSARARAKW